MIRRGLNTRPVWTVLAAAVSATAYAGLVEPRWFRLTHTTVPVLRPTARGVLRVLHLSDLHQLPEERGKLAFVRDCARLEPDLVVATGDLLGHPWAVEPVIGALGELARGRPAVAVLGSNDFYAPRRGNPLRYLLPGARRPRQLTDHLPRLDTRRLVAGLEDGGWTVLENRRTLVDTPAGLVDVAGLGDPHIRRDRPGRVDWTPEPDAVARLGLVHAPYRHAVAAFAARGFDLVLAGHTHGGQLRLPLVGALVANCDLPLRQARGLSRHRIDARPGSAGEIWLHVSGGLGTSSFTPLRFACRPQATILDLVEAPGSDGRRVEADAPSPYTSGATPGS